ncbi:MAG: type IV pili methyl-accepting chemotaxis transducer N-terminal domain-containing protein [Campylobacterota bacterium]|nr:type IV pili methyl-accepting chemotaxis transducer N-terminal domain-containing protein [Campylobacterota bacterium]
MAVKDINKKRLSVALIVALSFSTFVVAEEKLSTLELINIAGKQRMLSQRIAKDYLYKGGDIAVSKADKQLSRTLKESQYAHNKLKGSIDNPRIVNLLQFVEMNNEDILSKTKEEFNTDNAQYVLDLSETMLEGNEYIMNSLSKTSKADTSKLIDLSARQGMLAQRIAKYYIAYQLGIRDKNTINQMNKAVESFTENHKILMNNKVNTPIINKKFKRVDRLWNVVYKFYLDIKMGGLPLIVFNTSDDITSKMDEISSLYVDLKK